MPTVTLGYPANIPGLPGHNWSSGIASATPIAHKGVVAGAKVQAMTVLDLLTKPELIKGAWDYFNNVQTKDEKYIPFITRDTPPPTHLNKAILEKYREQMRKFYYDPTKFPTYLDQLGHQVPDGHGRQLGRSDSSSNVDFRSQISDFRSMVISRSKSEIDLQSVTLLRRRGEL